MRRALEPVVLAGLAVCAKCGEPIGAGAEWHLGHSDDRTHWTGPEHPVCNLRAAAAKTNGRRRVHVEPPPPPGW